jgi:hypothetical protein
VFLFEEDKDHQYHGDEKIHKQIDDVRKDDQDTPEVEEKHF